jgi:glutamine amidotransferase
VGAFDHAVRELKRRSLFDPIAQAVRAGKPYLGLCLGLQLLFEGSAEGREAGFGILKGRSRRFPQGLKVPHMGWNRVRFDAPDCPYWKGIPDGAYFYFVHSYYAAPEDPALRRGTTDYGTDFASLVWSKNIFATQFHPEKSQETGLRLLRNIVGSP